VRGVLQRNRHAHAVHGYTACRSGRRLEILSGFHSRISRLDASESSRFEIRGRATPIGHGSFDRDGENPPAAADRRRTLREWSQSAGYAVSRWRFRLKITSLQFGILTPNWL